MIIKGLLEAVDLPDAILLIKGKYFVVIIMTDDKVWIHLTWSHLAKRYLGKLKSFKAR